MAISPSSLSSSRRIRIPNNWAPREYQLPAWKRLEKGCKRVVLVWHRRSGKDSLCLNWTAAAAFARVGVYWHMLPEAEQARKAIWNGIDKQGRRIIDQAFPKEIRRSTNSQEMRIEFVNGSIWQLCGSDNYNSLVGSNPVGVVFSEWSLAKPSAWDYIRPILAENDGWALFVYTPRGRNHGLKTLEIARSNPKWFQQVLTVAETGVISKDIIQEELDSGMDEDMVLQEYYCSFDAALQGSYYGRLLNEAQRDGRIGEFGLLSAPVHIVWDLGRSDDTAVWFYQLERTEVRGVWRPRVIDAYASHGHHLDFYIDTLRAKGYQYGLCWLPHDARSKTLGAKRTIERQLRDAKFSVRFVPNTSIDNGIAATRKTLRTAVWNEQPCADGLEALRQYQREWNEDKRCFEERPKHDWTSHYADCARYLSLVWTEPHETAEPKPIDWDDVKPPTFDQVLARNDRRERRRGL
jgi:phage terminase large subunit